MSSLILHRILQINDDEFKLLLNNNVPLVTKEGQTYKCLWELIQAYSFFSDPNFIQCFAEMSNFFWKGADFECIRSIEEYQQFYQQQSALEYAQPGDVFAFRVTDYELFDVSVMHEPLLEGKQLSYYVYQVATKIPFRVSCPFPYETASTIVRYQILPLLKDASTNQKK